MGCLIVIVLAAVSVWMAMTPVDRVPVPTQTERQDSRNHVSEIKTELESVKKASREGKPSTFTIKLTENDLNTYLDQDAEAQATIARRKVTQAYVRIADRQVRASITLPVGGASMTVTTTMVPVVDESNWSLFFRVEGVSVGRLGVPGAAARRLAEDLAKSLAAHAYDPDVEVRSVQFEGNALILTGGDRRPNHPTESGRSSGSR